jgi:hypothetical protein
MSNCAKLKRIISSPLERNAALPSDFAPRLEDGAKKAATLCEVAAFVEAFAAANA